MKRFYFTSMEHGDVGNDHLGNIRGAIMKAKKLAAELKSDIYINDCASEDIMEVIMYDQDDGSVY